ncbi:cytidine deaminase [Halorubrum sp. CBA1125]|jgi:cytidine deaminase|uniref:cytidine deaminase n=1 Tax=Halorubrum sp. CBA1125 TaxID=2668072 RepID=UPI0012E76A7A|nr:cytidine deaminase [Halorubrum sp. CBA1125]
MEKLLEEAERALDRAYAPYSEYQVGAALRTTDGVVYTGCNIEFANYTNTLHAEEVALSKAVSDGHTDLDALALTSAQQSGNAPCGMCRQSLREFCDDEFPIVVDEGDGYVKYTMAEILPHAMDSETLLE